MDTNYLKNRNGAYQIPDLTSNVTIAFIGDIFLGSDPKAVDLSQSVISVLRSADFVVANLEGPITNHDIPTPRKSSLKSSIEAVDKLKDWGIVAVTLANNHMFDFGWKGYQETTELLARKNIEFFGAGKDLDDAVRPIVVEVKGKRFGFLTFAWDFVQATCATNTSYGCAPLDPEIMKREIVELKKDVDHVIVIPHWGYCGFIIPLPEHRALGRILIESGASAIVGCHSHTVQGVDMFLGKPVAHSIGNFIFAPFVDRNRAYEFDEEEKRGVIFELKISQEELITYRRHNTYFDGKVVNLLEPEEANSILIERDNHLSVLDYDKMWEEYCRSRLLSRLIYWINPFHWRHVHKETLQGFYLMIKNSIICTGPFSTK